MDMFTMKCIQWDAYDEMLTTRCLRRNAYDGIPTSELQPAGLGTDELVSCKPWQDYGRRRAMYYSITT